MARNSRRVKAALKSVLPQLPALDALPDLKSVALTVFFDHKGDYTHVTPRFDVATDPVHLTAPAETSP